MNNTNAMRGIGGFEAMVASAMLSLGVAGAGYFASKTLYNARVGINTAEVKGLAERRVEADRAFWKIGYTVSGVGDAELPKLYAQSKAAQEKIVALLLKSGFEPAEISPEGVEIRKEEFRDKNQRLVEERVQLVGVIAVESSKVHLVVEARSKLSALISEGLEIENNAPSYQFTKLNEIKPEMLKEATQNARLAADQFAEDAEVEVGGIRDAEQGAFLVHDVGDEESDGGRIEKDIRVVTTISFYLTEPKPNNQARYESEHSARVGPPSDTEP